MASLEQRGNRFRIIFRYCGKKFQQPLKTDKEKDAQGSLARLEENLQLLERGRLEVPPDADLALFLLSDGKVTKKVTSAPAHLTLDALCKKYVEVHSGGAMEATSLQTVEMHLRHFRKSFGDSFVITRLKQSDLQDHVTRRSKMDGIRKRKVSPITLRKEMGSFRALWNWGVRSELLSGLFPNRGLVYPKTDEKPVPDP
jgi:hypothetical protein